MAKQDKFESKEYSVRIVKLSPKAGWSFEKLLDYLPKLEGIYFDNSFTKKYLERVKNDFLTDWEFNLQTPDE